MAVLSDIQLACRAHRKRFALLLDPEKADLHRLFSPSAAFPDPSQPDLSVASPALPDYIFVGGSTGGRCDAFVRTLRTLTRLPIILFPGSAAQFTPAADALLFLSLLSGSNPDYLNGQQIRSARAVQQSGIETIPMGYILVDGGVETSVMRVTRTLPIPQTDISRIVDTAIAARLMGKSLVYLEAGSGAHTPVSEEIIRAVRAAIPIPLIVGGGIRTAEQMQSAYRAGADIVVIGNHFESHPEQLSLFCQARDSFLS